MRYLRNDFCFIKLEKSCVLGVAKVNIIANA